VHAEFLRHLTPGRFEVGLAALDFPAREFPKVAVPFVTGAAAEEDEGASVEDAG